MSFENPEVVQDHFKVYIPVAIIMLAFPVSVLVWRFVSRQFAKLKGQVKARGKTEAIYDTFTRKGSQKLAMFMSTSRFGVYWLLFQVAVTVIACIETVLETYADGPRPIGLAIVEIVVTSIFTVDLALAFYAAQDKLQFSTRLFTIIDLVAILPVWIHLVQGTFFSDTTHFLRPLSIFRAIRVAQAYRYLSVAGTTVRRQLLLILFSIAILFYVGASLIQVVEATSDLEQNEFQYWHESLYFTVVTFVTVGYGDVTPRSTQGRMVSIGLILVGFFVLTLQSGKLISLLSSRTPYEGQYHLNPDPHIVVCGDVTYSAVVYFFKELYHRSRKSQNLRVVFLSRKEPPLNLKNLLDTPFYSTRVFYFVGRALNPDDLARVKLDRAVACFVMNNKFRAGDPDADGLAVLRSIAVKEYAPHIPVIVQLNSRKSARYLRDCDIDIVLCMDEIRMLILGQNSICPGFSTLLSNLVLTFSSKDDNPEFSHLWAAEYYRGCTNQLYNVMIPQKFAGHKFTDVATRLYSLEKILLIGVRVQRMTDDGEEEEGMTLLNPGQAFVFEGGEIGLVICTHRVSQVLPELLNEVDVEPNLDNDPDEFYVGLDTFTATGSPRRSIDETRPSRAFVRDPTLGLFIEPTTDDDEASTSSASTPRTDPSPITTIRLQEPKPMGSPKRGRSLSQGPSFTAVQRGGNDSALHIKSSAIQEESKTRSPSKSLDMTSGRSKSSRSSASPTTSPSAVAFPPGTTLGERLKHAKSTPISHAPPSTIAHHSGPRNSGGGEHAQLHSRRVSFDVPRRDSTQDDEGDYAKTISTDQPFHLELTKLREHLRPQPTQFKRKKFEAPVRESIEESLNSASARISAQQTTNTNVQRADNYYLLPQARKPKQFVVSGRDHMFTHKEPHILVCGEFHSAFISFISPLRTSKLSRNRIIPVVFLHITQPAAHILKVMAQYPEVYFVEGSMLTDFDLRRAGIRQARRVIITTTLVRTATEGRVESSELVDSNAIFAFRNISLSFPSVDFIAAEMAEGFNMRFLDVGPLLAHRKLRTKLPHSVIGRTDTTISVLKDTLRQRNTTPNPYMQIEVKEHSKSAVSDFLRKVLVIPQDSDRVLDYPEYHFRPHFAGGHVWSASLLDAMFAQVLFTPSLIETVKAFAGGPAAPRFFEKTSAVFQIPLPTESEGFTGSSFGELFEFMMSKDIIPVALYRSHAESECEMPYVYTNPDTWTRLYSSDLVFVLALQDPTETLLKRTSM